MVDSTRTAMPRPRTAAGPRPVVRIRASDLVPPRAPRRRVGRVAGALLVLVGLVIVVVVGAVRASSPPPVANVAVTLAPSRTVPGKAPDLPWALPAGAQAAVAVPAIGYVAQSGPEHAVPVASMTKVMTAYVVLRDHPLGGSAPGPSITVTQADASDFTTDIVTTQASVALQAGEVLTERQALDGLLVHSANDLAFTLACWDAGSVPAFVARMNAAAVSLGMTRTHFADASGYTPGSVSTPSDLLKVAVAAMADPAFSQAVAMPTVTLPVGGTVSTYTPLLPGGTEGAPGVVGVKSGYTTAAGGGDILAYGTAVDGRPIMVLTAVTSLRGPTVLDRAGLDDLAVAKAAASSVVPVAVGRAGEQVGTVSVPGTTVRAVAAAPGSGSGSGSLLGSVLAVPGQRVRQAVTVSRRPQAGARAGARVGTAVFSLGRQRISVPVRTAGAIPAPGLAQRLF